VVVVIENLRLCLGIVWCEKWNGTVAYVIDIREKVIMFLYKNVKYFVL
jgi:hypothetical protein